MNCREALVSPRARESPFQRVIVLDWYDGIKSGVAECAGTREVFGIHFCSWDDEQSVRIFALTPLPHTVFADLIDLMSGLGPPRWPVWVPIWKFESHEERSRMERALAQLVVVDDEPDFLVASERLSDALLCGKSLAGVDARQEYNTLQTTGGSFHEWLEFIRHSA